MQEKLACSKLISILAIVLSLGFFVNSASAQRAIEPEGGGGVICYPLNLANRCDLADLDRDCKLDVDDDILIVEAFKGSTIAGADINIVCDNGQVGDGLINESDIQAFLDCYKAGWTSTSCIPTPTPSASVTATRTVTPTRTVTRTRTASPTFTTPPLPTVTATRTVTRTPTRTTTRTPTAISTPTALCGSEGC